MIYLCTGSVVKSFCAISGSSLAQQLRGHGADVTSIAFHPAHPEGKSLLTGSLDGTLRTWNTKDCSLSAVLNTPGPVESLVVSSPRGARHCDIAFLACLRKSTDKGRIDGARVYAYSLSSGQVVERLAKMSSSPTLETSSCGDVFGVFERNTILIWSNNSGEISVSRTRVRLHHTKQITAMALYRACRFVAAGDVTGRILLWYNVLNSMNDGGRNKKFQRSSTNVGLCGSKANTDECSPHCTFHWHSRPVKCLLFSADGMFLLSGGEESVMVVWKHDEARKSYLPRLGAPLSNFFEFPRDTSRIVVACVDNSLRVVSLSSLAIECTIQGIRPSSSYYGMRKSQEGQSSSTPYDLKLRSMTEPKHHSFNEASTKSCLTLEPISGALASSAAGANVQLFDFLRDSHVSDIHVSPNMHAAYADMIGGRGESIVTHIVFSHSGTFLATVSQRLEGATLGLDMFARVREAEYSSDSLETNCTETLKIWERRGSFTSKDSPANDNSNVGFDCVTTCDAPHKCDVTSVAFQGGKLEAEAMICTVSVDGEIKLWKRSIIFTKSKLLAWSCCSVMSHSEQRIPSIFSVSFSDDGSLLATGSDDILLWDPGSCARLDRLKHSVRSNETGSKCLQSASDEASLNGDRPAMKFIAGEPLFVSLRARRVVIWNLVTATVVRVLSFPGVKITAHPSSHSLYVSIHDQNSFLARSSGFSQSHEFGIYIVKLEGPKLQATRCWESLAGKPKEVLIPRDKITGSIAIVTENKTVVTMKSYDGSQGENAYARAMPPGELLAYFKTDQELAPATAVDSDMVNLHLKSLIDRAKIPSANHSIASSILPGRQLKGIDTHLMQNVIQYCQKRDGIDATSGLSSHDIPQLTSLAPRFLDNLLARRHKSIGNNWGNV